MRACVRGGLLAFASPHIHLHMQCCRPSLHDPRSANMRGGAGFVAGAAVGAAVALACAYMAFPRSKRTSGAPQPRNQVRPVRV